MEREVCRVHPSDVDVFDGASGLIAYLEHLRYRAGVVVLTGWLENVEFCMQSLFVATEL